MFMNYEGGDDFLCNIFTYTFSIFDGRKILYRLDNFEVIKLIMIKIIIIIKNATTSTLVQWCLSRS